MPVVLAAPFVAPLQQPGEGTQPAGGVQLAEVEALTAVTEPALPAMVGLTIIRPWLAFTIFRLVAAPSILLMVAQQPDGGVGHGAHFALS